MKLIFLALFIFLVSLIHLQPTYALDYIQSSSPVLPINLTIFETVGTYVDTATNDSGNFSNYLIGFEVFLENHSVEIENYTYDPFGQRIKILRNDSANTTIYTPFKELMYIGGNVL